METTILESPQAQGRQKANIDLKIELPNSEKPFFNKLATENNMITQVKKAGTKLAENENLTVSVMDRTINLTKEETGRIDLKSVIQEKLIDQEVSKTTQQEVSTAKTPDNEEEQNVSKSLKPGSIREFEGEYNGVFQKLWVANDTNHNLYTTEQLEYADKNGVKVVDADSTKWKAITNESYSKIDNEMSMKGVVRSEIIGEVSALKQTSSLPDNLKKNMEYLVDQVKFLGFGQDEKLQEKLKSMVSSDQKQFTIAISSDKTSFQNKMNFNLHFNKADTGTVFFNKFEAHLTNESKGTDLQHTFAVKNNGFTAKQAINLLEGRAVKTEIKNPNTGEKETAFVKLKLNEPKNENGNFKLQVFNKNYGVNAASIVERSNLVFKDEKHKEITIKSLEKGNIVAVKFKSEEKEQEGKAILNPQYKTLNLYDQNLKRLNTNAPVLENTVKDGAAHQVKAQQHQSRKL